MDPQLPSEIATEPKIESPSVGRIETDESCLESASPKHRSRWRTFAIVTSLFVSCVPAALSNLWNSCS